MTNANPEELGLPDFEADEQEPSSTTEGPAAEGKYDPAQGSPDSGTHPTAESYPQEVSRYDEPERRRPSGNGGD